VPKTHFTLYTDEVGGGGGGLVVASHAQKICVKKYKKKTAFLPSFRCFCMLCGN
jgi:hypothetical protein